MAIPVRAKVVNASNGNPITSGVVAYHVQGTTRSAVAGTAAAHIANGWWYYLPTWAETQYPSWGIEFYHTDAVCDGPIVEFHRDFVRQEVERLAGVREWPTYGNATLFAHEANDNAMATFPGSCLWDGAAWRLYYTALNGSGQLICRYRSSTDGKTSWSAGTTVLEPSGSGWDNGRVLIPIVWKEGANDWRMIYTGRDSAGANDAIGYATSSDGITWTKSGSNPVMTGNASNWERGEIEATGVIKVDSTYYMWYNSSGFATGHDPSARQSSYATSTNLTSWTKSTTCVWGNDDDEDVVGPDYGTLGGTCLKLTSNYYYYFSIRTGGNTDYQWIEVWESHLPTFPKANRRFVGIIQTVKDTAFPTREIDVLCFAADDIGMDTFTQASGEVRMYFGAKHSTLWYVGLATASDYIEALRPACSRRFAIPGDKMDLLDTIMEDS